MDAYRHGVVITCVDGVTRRFYPRIFAYIADYPEKCVVLEYYSYYAILPSDSINPPHRTLAASIRNRGRCPCPHCLIQLSDVHRMGQKVDQSKRRRLIRTDNLARRAKVERSSSLIYNGGYAVDATAIENLLFDESWVPTAVSASVILSSYSF